MSKEVCHYAISKLLPDNWGRFFMHELFIDIEGFGAYQNI